MCISFIGAFLGILWVAGCAHALNNQFHENLLVASLGATAVLLYGVMENQSAQPRNVIGMVLNHVLNCNQAELVVSDLHHLSSICIIMLCAATKATWSSVC